MTTSARRSFSSCRFVLSPTLNINGLFGNRIAIAAVTAVIGFQLLITYLPLMNLFGTAPLDRMGWLSVVLVAATVLPLVEIEKFILRSRARR